MNSVLWIVQILLAGLFLMHGIMMWTQPPARQERLAYILALPVGLRRFVGAAEILGAVGVILPALTGILPWLTPLAALGFVIVMLGAGVFHIPRQEYGATVFNLVLLALAAFIVYGRFALVPL